MNVNIDICVVCRKERELVIGDCCEDCLPEYTFNRKYWKPNPKPTKETLIGSIASDDSTMSCPCCRAESEPEVVCECCKTDKVVEGELLCEICRGFIEKETELRTALEKQIKLLKEEIVCSHCKSHKIESGSFCDRCQTFLNRQSDLVRQINAVKENRESPVKFSLRQLTPQEYIEVMKMERESIFS